MDRCAFAAAVMYRASPFYMPPPQAPPAGAAYYHTVQEQQQQWPVIYPRMAVAQDKMIPAAAPQQHQQPPSHPGAAVYQSAAAPGNARSAAPLHVVHLPAADAGGPSRETLQLFPLQPTFLLPDKGRAAGTSASTASASFSEKSESPGSLDSNGNGDAPAVPFYDFFGLQSGGR